MPACIFRVFPCAYVVLCFASSEAVIAKCAALIKQNLHRCVGQPLLLKCMFGSMELCQHAACSSIYRAGYRKSQSMFYWICMTKNAVS